jgi:hypothetical protein
MCNEREIREEKWGKEIIGHHGHIGTLFFTHLVFLEKSRWDNFNYIIKDYLKSL